MPLLPIEIWLFAMRFFKRLWWEVDLRAEHDVSYCRPRRRRRPRENVCVLIDYFDFVAKTRVETEGRRLPDWWPAWMPAPLLKGYIRLESESYE